MVMDPDITGKGVVFLTTGPYLVGLPRCRHRQKVSLAFGKREWNWGLGLLCGGSQFPLEYLWLYEQSEPGTFGDAPDTQRST